MNNTLHSKLLFLLLLLCLSAVQHPVCAVQLSGTYTINASLPASTTNFQNLRSALRFLTSDSVRSDGGPSNIAPYGVNGPVVFSISSGTYTERLVLDGRKVPGLSPTNQLVFDGGASSPVITFNISGAVVVFTQCKYVGIRNVIINNTGTSNASGVAIFGNANAIKNGTGCFVKKCTIGLLTKTGSGSAIALSDSNYLLSSQQWADSVEIDSNTITGGAYGIIVHGAVSNAYNKQIKVRHNNISRVHYGALFYKVYNGIELLFNTISSTGDDGPTNTTEDLVKFTTCNTTNGLGHRIVGNRLDADYRALNIENTGGDSLNPNWIYNNMIGARVAGIYITQSTNVKNYFRIYHNSVYIRSSMYYPYYLGNPFTHSAISQQGGIICKNNIFAIADAGKDTTLAVLVNIDNDTTSRYNYNVYYNPSGGSGRMFVRKNVTYVASNMLTPGLAGDSSIIAKPSFVSNTDLHLTHGCQLKGVDLTAEVPLDIDGEPRSPNPYAGCDEYVSAALDLSTEAIVSPSFPANQGLQDLKIRVRNTGTTSITSFTASYVYNNITVSQSWSGTLNPCDTAWVTFTGANQINIDSNAVSLKVFTSNPNGGVDLLNQNDTIMSKQLKGMYTIGDTLCDYKNFTSAINDLYQRGVGGDILFKVKAGTYNEQVKFIGSRIAGGNAFYRITFEGAAADSCIISANKPSEALVIMQNTRYVTFRKFTINNTNTVSSVGVAIIGNALASKYNGTGCEVKQCKINLIAATATGIHLTSAIGGSSTGACNSDSLVFDSNTITGGSYGIYISGSTDIATNVGFKIRSNRIENASNCSVYMIWVNNGVDVIKNTFTGSVSCNAGYSMSGLTNTGLYPLRLLGNTIDVNATYGIYLLGCFAVNPASPTKIYNNRITNAYTGIYCHPGASTTPPTTNYEIYHNSVSMNRVPSGTGYPFYFSNGNTTSSVLCKNNIFAVTSPTGLGIPIYIITPLGPGDVNFNNYYNSTGPVLVYRGSSLTKDTYKTMAGGGDSSMNIKPEWISATDLRLTLGCIERGTNLNVMVAKDINDSLRGSKPNLGCYEFQPYSIDLTIQALTAPTYPVIAGLQNVKVKLINNGSGVITGANVSLVLNGAPPITIAWTGALAQCDTTIVTFPNITLLNQNILKVYVSTPSEMNVLNDTLTLPILTTMAGTYVIGDTLSDYKTFALAAADLNTRGVGGAVLFNVKSGLYTEQVELNSGIQGISAANTITFQSMALQRDSVKLQFKSSSASVNFVFRLNNISYVRLRLMTLEGLDSNYSKVIDFVGTSSYNIIDSCIIISKSISGTGDRVGIYANGLGGKNNIIRNNFIQNGAIGIYWWGVSQTDLTDSNFFEKNTITGFLQYGIYAQYTRNNKFHNNSISTSVSGVRGLYITYGYDRLAITSNTIKLTGGTGYGMFLGFNTGTFYNRGMIVNNTISVTGSVVTASAYGIGANTGTYQMYYNNSIQVASGSLASYAAYFQYASTAASNNELKNNILSNTATGCALFFYSINTSNQCDYNLLYSSGASLVERNAAYPNPLKLANLDAWRAVTVYDKHSISYRPPFTATSADLIPNPADSAIWAINGRGIHPDSTFFTTDKNGITRPLSPEMGVPDLGAYECTPVSLPPLCVASPASMPTSSLTDTSQLFFFGSDTVAKITWSASSVIPSVVKVRQYTGQQPPAIGSAQQYMFTYTTIDLPTATAPSYVPVLFYQDEWKGTNTSETDLRVVESIPFMPWTLDPSSSVDTLRNLLTRSLSTNINSVLTGSNVNNPLPLSLLNLSAKWKGRSVLINWATTSEVNTDYMEVQRSTDGKHFTRIGKVVAAGNSYSLRQYEWLDEFIEKNTVNMIYYRLKIVDKSGIYSYSYIVHVKRNDPKNETATVFPNPFNADIYVSIPVKQNTLLQWSIFDLAGKLLVRNEEWITEETNLQSLSGNTLAPGIFILQLEYNGTQYIKKIVKQ